MEWNMEKNFSMEWNMEKNFSMEWKIFGMEWKKIASMEYGKIVFHTMPWVPVPQKYRRYWHQESIALL